MTVAEPSLVEHDRRDTAPSLTVKVGTAAYTLHTVDTPVVIGRDDPQADRRVHIAVSDDNRISRRHLVVDLLEDHWVGVPEGSNGVFVNGVRAERPFPIPDDGLTVVLGDPNSGIPVQFSTLDPALVHVGTQIAKRRAELDISQRTLAANKIINAGVLISVEKGRSWPRERTQHKLEEALGWPRGTLANMRRGHRTVAAEPAEPIDGERTEVFATGTTTTVDASYLADTVALALAGLRDRIDTLPAPSDPEFQPRVSAVLAQLAQLEVLARNASRGASGSSDVFVQLSAVRRAHRELMMRAARSPTATLGQRVFAARYHAELTVGEAAAMVGLAAEELSAVEAGGAVDAPCATALRRLLTVLH